MIIDRKPFPQGLQSLILTQVPQYLSHLDPMSPSVVSSSPSLPCAQIQPQITGLRLYTVCSVVFLFPILCSLLNASVRRANWLRTPPWTPALGFLTLYMRRKHSEHRVSQRYEIADRIVLHHLSNGFHSGSGAVDYRRRTIRRSLKILG
jgi:hypothetical protein